MSVLLPGHERAVIDPAKLIDYCLNPLHTKGRHKARKFQSALGLTAQQWPVLRDAIVAAVAVQQAVEADSDGYGRRYRVELEMTTPVGTAKVRSCWIVRQAEDFPRLTSCYVLR